MDQCHVYCSIYGWLLSSSCTVFEIGDGFVQLFVYRQSYDFYDFFFSYIYMILSSINLFSSVESPSF